MHGRSLPSAEHECSKDLSSIGRFSTCTIMGCWEGQGASKNITLLNPDETDHNGSEAEIRRQLRSTLRSKLYIIRQTKRAWGIHQGHRISPRCLGAFRSELSESQLVALARLQYAMMNHTQSKYNFCN